MRQQALPVVQLDLKFSCVTAEPLCTMGFHSCAHAVVPRDMTAVAVNCHGAQQVGIEGARQGMGRVGTPEEGISIAATLPADASGTVRLSSYRMLVAMYCGV